MENCCEESPHTWRMFSFLLRFLIMNLMVGVIFTEPENSVDDDVDADTDNYAELRGC